MDITSIAPAHRLTLPDGRVIAYRSDAPASRVFSILERTTVDPLTECWMWQGSINPGGYGIVTFQNKSWTIHRLVVYLLVGELDKGNHLHHTCKRRTCCNPLHLESVTPVEHSRLEGLARHVTECPKGHAMTPENTYVFPGRDKRRCRICHNDYQKRHRSNPRILKVECYRGHPFSSENTRIYQGRRYCKACHAENTLRYYHESKEVPSGLSS